jgi:hypothetical protein
VKAVHPRRRGERTNPNSLSGKEKTPAFRSTENLRMFGEKNRRIFNDFHFVKEREGQSTNGG